MNWWIFPNVLVAALMIYGCFFLLDMLMFILKSAPKMMVWGWRQTMAGAFIVPAGFFYFFG